MLEKPDLDDQLLIDCLQQHYGLPITQVRFLALGADIYAAVYGATSQDGTAYFVKLRSNGLNEVSLTLPRLLFEQGLRSVIPPLPGLSGQLWAELEQFAVIVYPFVAGQNGYEHNLSEQQWADFGRTLNHVHSLQLPENLAQSLPAERYDARWCSILREYMQDQKSVEPKDQITADMLVFLRQKSDEILAMIEHAERYAQILREQQPELVVCHTDAHAANVLIDWQGLFYLVDWDNPMLAPKERDLMFIGGGFGFKGCTAAEEEQYFYAGYGQTAINTAALAYYRFVRIVEDIALYYEQIMLSNSIDEDRQQALYYVQTNFQAGSTLERAYAAGLVDSSVYASREAAKP